jgi:sulfopyruvate decarboxylase TPP-binding subunit
MAASPSAPSAASATLDAARVLALLKERGVTHLVWLPDSESAVLYELVRADQALTLVQVCREGEAFGVAAGLFVAGKKPAILIQSTGFFESGDSIRGIALWLRLPLLLLIGYRGWQAEGTPQDTAAHFLEPILDAWGIPHQLVRHDGDLPRLVASLERAEATSRPAAALIAAEWR